ncbi:MAG TPA: GAF domain-containing protein [Anaerolineales bacterium]|nr:GAF domain-containing protein [Anaerolineales bacterium]
MNNFFNTIKNFFTGPASGDNPSSESLLSWRFTLARRTFRVIAIITLPAILASTYYAVSEGTYSYIPIYMVMLVVIFVVAFGKFVNDKTRMWGLMGLIYFIVLLDFYTEGRGSLARAFLVVFSFLGAIFFGRRGAITSAVTGLLTMILFAYLFTANILPDYQISSLAVSGWVSNTVILAVLISLVVYSVNYLVQDMTRFLAQSQELTQKLEERVVERTKALETSAEISRRLTAILDPRDLAKAVVDQVQSAFDYYYAQIYLFDVADENLVLTAGTGEAGAEMMKRGHALPKGRGLVGRAAETQESILVSDTSKDPNWLPNELLPDTKAEAVVPISIGDQVFGVLDVQDDVTNDINADDMTLLESLASQVAISLQNAESYAKAEAALQEAKSLVENAPEAIVVVDLTTGLFTDPNKKAEILYKLSQDELLKVGPAQMSPPTQPDGRDSTEAAMEKIGEAMEGGTPVFEWVHRNGEGEDFQCEIHLIRLPGDKPRVRATIIDITERKQLQEFTAKRARQQEAINLITQKIQAATTIEEAMQVAARELGHAVGQKQTVVVLEPSALGGNGKTTVNE